MFVILTKKNIFVIILAILVVIATTFALKTFLSAKQNENWGLSFQIKGEPPSGNATAEDLKKYNAYYISDTSKKKIYITFDAGYEAGILHQK